VVVVSGVVVVVGAGDVVVELATLVDGDVLAGGADVEAGDVNGRGSFLRSIGADLPALAGLFANHHPVVRDWSAITVPMTVVTGTDDAVAAPPEAVASRLAGADVVRVPGDHITAPTTNEFVDLVAAVARGTR
jgi:pimeloyl-ACP methyl ester carboxylesterase